MQNVMTTKFTELVPGYKTLTGAEQLKAKDELLNRVWALLQPSQQFALLASEEFTAMAKHLASSLDTVASEAIGAKINSELREGIVALSLVIAEAGYSILEGEAGFFWENAKYRSNDYADVCDAVMDAYQDLQSPQSDGENTDEGEDDDPLLGQMKTFCVDCATDLEIGQIGLCADCLPPESR